MFKNSAKAPRYFLTFVIVAPKTSPIFGSPDQETRSIMSKYRARHCPKCSYFIGFAIARPAIKSREAALTNFCLNCNYRLPVRSIIDGIRRSAPPMRSAGGLRLVHNIARASARGAEGESRCKDMDTKISSQDYARHLRAIGQDLEILHFSQFNLEFTGDAYLVWVKGGENSERSQPLLRIGKSRLQKLWRNHIPPRTIGQEESFPLSSSQTGRRLRYSVQELDRIEREQRARRRRQSANADGHSLSQLLRTLGDLLGQRSERLLGIAWQDLSIGVVIETPQGRKEIEVFRPDNLYDLWVRMYLKRDNRALFDTPH
jgi:hypothetical protein